MTGLSILALTSYNNRLHYQTVSLSEFYAWAYELRMGGDPWLSPHDPAFRNIPGVAHLGHCNYPPAFLLAFEPLTALTPIAAYWIWYGIIVASLLLATVLLTRELGPPASSSYLLAIGAVLIFPEVYGSLYESQPTFLLLALVVVAWVCDRRGSSAPAGLALAIGALLKLYPALAGGYFLVRRRWITLGWATLFGIAGMMLVNVRYQRDYAHYGILTSVWLSDDAWLRNARSIAMLSNLRAILDWLYGGPLPRHAMTLWLGLTALADLLVIAAVVEVTIRARDRRELDALCLGLWLVAAIIVSPIAWGHYLPFAIPLLLGLAACVGCGARPHPVGAVLVVSGLSGTILPYFSSPMRQLHMLFWATLLIFTGACLVVSGYSKPTLPISDTASLCR